MRPVTPAGELLLFKSVVDPRRRAVAARLLHDGLGGGVWSSYGDADLWELDDAAGLPGDGPVAVAATCLENDGRRAVLLGFVVTPALHGRGIGQRLLEDLLDALRGRGALTVATAVPSDQVADMVAVRRAGLRPSSAQGADRRDVVWFDLEL